MPSERQKFQTAFLYSDFIFQADDALISWKWLLNRKDITIVVAKENGKDLPLQTVARRVMALVEKNVARFAKANADKNARLENIKALEAEVETKRARLEELVKQIEAKENGAMPSEEAKPEFGEFGEIFTQFYHDAQGAVSHLMKVKTGEASGALHHPVIGDIDLIWGEEGDAANDYKGGFGLAKIAAKHPEVVHDLQGILSGLEIKEKSGNRAILESEHHKAVVSLQWLDRQKTWLLSEYEKSDAGSGRLSGLPEHNAAEDPQLPTSQNNHTPSTVNPQGTDMPSENEQVKDGITYAIWGKAPGSQYEELIADKVPLDDGEIVPIDTLKFAEFIKNDAEKKGYTEVRISAVNMGVKPDFAKAVGGKDNKGGIQTEPLDERKLKPLNVPENATAKEVRKALEDYLKQLQGKTVVTSDGKTVRFSKQSKGHLAHDAAVAKEIEASAIGHVVEVLKTGDFIGREDPYKERGDFAAFHVYRKWVDIGDREIHMQVKAAELSDKQLLAGDILLAYSTKDVSDKTKEAGMKPTSSVTDGAFDTSGNPSTNPSVVSSMTRTSAVSRDWNHTAVFDSVQDAPELVVEILEVRQKGGDVPSEADDSTAANLAYLEEIKAKGMGVTHFSIDGVNEAIDAVRQAADKGVSVLSYKEYLAKVEAGEAEGSTMERIRRSLAYNTAEMEKNAHRTRSRDYKVAKAGVEIDRLSVETEGATSMSNLWRYSEYLGRSIENGTSVSNKTYRKYIPLEKRLANPPAAYRVDTNTGSANTVKLYPETVGEKWTEEDRKNLLEWLKQAGLETMSDDDKPQVIGLYENTYELSPDDRILAESNIKKFPSYASLMSGRVAETEPTETENQEIDVSALDTDLGKYRQDGKSLFDAAKAFYNQNLKGKTVKTVIGNVHLLGSSWQEMKKGMPKDAIKAALIPFVPEILKNGSYEGRELPTKKPTNPTYAAFHSFSKQGLIVDGKEIAARVLVGERHDGQYEYVAYSLHHDNGSVMDDATSPESCFQGNA